jgi:hypothetical protein
MSRTRDAIKASEQELVSLHETYGKMPIEDCWRRVFNLDDEDMKVLEAILFVSKGMLSAGIMSSEAILLSIANIGKHLGQADQSE